jgi:hypothetical protein
VGVRGLPTEFVTARSQADRAEIGTKLAKTPFRNFQVDFGVWVLKVWAAVVCGSFV